MKLIFSFLMALVLVACTGSPDVFVVKQSQVRDQARDANDEPMLRMEKERRLHGAISMEERRQRLGQYYTLLWHHPSSVGQGPVEVAFQYQQGATASRVKRMTKVFPSSAAEGIAEFAIIGDDYFQGGKVLAWQATLRRGNVELATRRSYLWR